MERTEAVATRYDDEPSIPYNYYPPDAKTPTLCEVRGQWVYLFDAERARHKSKFQGRFVRLVEEESPAG